MRSYEKNVSVVVPVYNAEKYLRRCLDSIAAQSLTNLDIVLVNDGSTDGSPQICMEYVEKDKRFSLINQENGGPSAAKKTGTENAVGDYIVYIDNDDTISPTYIEELTAANSNGEYDLIIARFNDSDGRCYQDALPCGEYTQKQLFELFFSDVMLFENSMTFEFAKLHKTDIAAEAFNKIDIQLKAYDDCAFEFFYLLRCKKIRVIDKFGYNWLIRRNSTSHDINYMQTYLIDIGKFYSLMQNGIKDRSDKWMLDICAKKRIFFHYMRDFLRFGIFSAVGINIYDIDLPDEELQNKRIILYGAGAVGQSYRSRLTDRGVEPVLWVDLERAGSKCLSYDVSAVEDILTAHYDMIFISVLERSLAGSIMHSLIKMGVPSDKIVWKPPIQIGKIDITNYLGAK